MKQLFSNTPAVLLCLLFITCFSCAPKYGAYFPKPDYDANNYARSGDKNTDIPPKEKITASVIPAEVEPIVEIKKSDIELIESLELPETKGVENAAKNEQGIAPDGSDEIGRLELVEKKERNAVMTSREELIMDALRVKLQTMTKQEKKAFRKEVKHFAKTRDFEKLSSAYNISSPENTNATDTNTLLLVIIAILLPPLAVFLYEGEINKNFWINLLLTLLFYIPGLIHALILIL